MSKGFERPRGTRDFTPDAMAKRGRLASSLHATFRRHGYREIQTPTFEHLDLFKAKSGESVVKELYAFQDKGERWMTLRPELTAPVMRFYVNELSHEPKPLKIYYHGPCFRYEEPQEGRFREFWQFGVELIGPQGPAADAEVIALAHAAVQDAGLQGFDLHVGHIGALRAVVDALPLSDDEKADVFRRVDKDDEGLDARLDELGVTGTLRDAVVLVAGHARRIRLDDEVALDTYFGEARAALTVALEVQVMERIQRALSDLYGTLRLLHAHGVESAHVDLGVARGLDYYTGVVFEMHADALGAQSQIGGGGSYALTELFGGEPVGTCGFGLGFDRILLALENEGRLPAAPPAASVHVAVLGNAREGATRLARRLRAEGVATDLDLMGRSLGKALQYASKTGARFVLIAGEKDLAQDQVTLRDMESGDQATLPLPDAPRLVRERVEQA